MAVGGRGCFVLRERAGIDGRRSPRSSMRGMSRCGKGGAGSGNVHRDPGRRARNGRAAQPAGPINARGRGHGGGRHVRLARKDAGGVSAGIVETKIEQGQLELHRIWILLLVPPPPDVAHPLSPHRPCRPRRVSSRRRQPRPPPKTPAPSLKRVLTPARACLSL